MAWLSAVFEFAFSGLSVFLSDWGLSSVFQLAMLSLLSLLVKKVGDLHSVFLRCETTLSYMSTKLGYVEMRMDRAQATTRDGLRHLTQRLTEFDCNIGSWSVIKKWICEERDHWLMKHSAASWKVMTQVAQYWMLNEAIWLRITCHPSEAAEVEANTKRHVKNMQGVAERLLGQSSGAQTTSRSSQLRRRQTHRPQCLSCSRRSLSTGPSSSI